MGFQNTMDALRLRMPRKVPRTEYSVSGHWPLIRRVTGIPVTDQSPDEVKTRASMAFEKAWDFGLTWSILIGNDALTGPRTTMGHAVYQEGGADFDAHIQCPFHSVEEVLSFDPLSAYGPRRPESLVHAFDDHYDRLCQYHPDQVNMTGIYITMVSGLLEIFGWNMLLNALSEDADAFGQVANRYADWILPYFQALAQSKAPVVMIHDDIVWTSGAFVRPEWYRKYIFPNYEKLFDPLHRAGKILLYTSDGTFTRFTEDIVACGVSGLVMEPTTDMAAIARLHGKTHAFIGNADCRALTFGTFADIRREVERCMNIGKDCPGFIMAVGNHIPPNVPVENALYYNECYEEMAYRD